MKVLVEKKELQKRLSNVLNIVGRSNAIPILNHFLLAAEKGGAYITATDLETTLKEPIKLDIAEEGRVCIHARNLSRVIKEMKGKINLESVGTERVAIKSGQRSLCLETLSTDDFPFWPDFERSGGMEIDSSSLLEIINKSIYAAGDEGTSRRRVLTGLLFYVRPDGLLTVVSTDAHRMVVLERAVVSRTEEDKKVIVPKKAVAKLRRFLEDRAKTVSVVFGEKHILFRIDGLQFSARLVEGAYPEYEKVIPTENEKILTVDRSLLVSSLKNVSAIDKDGSNKVAFTLDNNSGSMIISASRPGIGEAKDEINSSYSGDTMTIAFNAKYLLDALNVMSSRKVTFRLNRPCSPALITGDRDKDYTYLVMPMDHSRS